LNIGIPNTAVYDGGDQGPREGLPLQSMGGTSCYRTSRVILRSVDITITGSKSLGNKGHTYQYNGQILTTHGAKPGDSGAVFFTRGSCPTAVGLEFAEATLTNLTTGQKFQWTVLNPMPKVIEGLPLQSMSGQTCQTPLVTSVAASTFSDQLNNDAVVPENSTETAAALVALNTKNQVSAVMMQTPHVWGVGVGSDLYGRQQIVVMVDLITQQIRSAVPPTMNGVQVTYMMVDGPATYDN
jgi:hypothetical protein